MARVHISLFVTLFRSPSRVPTFKYVLDYILADTVVLQRRKVVSRMSASPSSACGARVQTGLYCVASRATPTAPRRAVVDSRGGVITTVRGGYIPHRRNRAVDERGSAEVEEEEVCGDGPILPAWSRTISDIVCVPIDTPLSDHAAHVWYVPDFLDDGDAHAVKLGCEKLRKKFKVDHSFAVGRLSAMARARFTLGHTPPLHSTRASSATFLTARTHPQRLYAIHATRDPKLARQHIPRYRIYTTPCTIVRVETRASRQRHSSRRRYLSRHSP